MFNSKDAERYIDEQNSDGAKVKVVNTTRKDHICAKCKTTIVKGSSAIVESKSFTNKYAPETKFYSSKYFHLACHEKGIEVLHLSGIKTQEEKDNTNIDNMEIVNNNSNNINNIDTN